MNNGLRPPKVTISVEAMPYFSASIAKMRISPVTRVVMSVPEACCAADLSVSIVGKCGENEFLNRSDFERVCITSEMYNSKPQNIFALEFDFDSFSFDEVFLNSLEDEVMADIYVLVNYGGNEYVAKTHIMLLPYNTWLGLEGEPSVISCFVKDDCSIVKQLCEGVCEDGRMLYEVTSRKSALAVIKNLYKKLKDCNIIYTRPAGYASNSKQEIRSIEELFGCSSILATPLEIALVFCSCAKYAGFDISLMFVRGVDGEIGVLCGVYLVKSPIDVPVCEDAQMLAKLVEAKDMLVVDPSVFAAAQNTSFVMALENTAESFIKNSDSLVCNVEINKALECVYGKSREDIFKGHTVKNSVALVYSSLVSSPVMQFLAGSERPDIEKIPLLLCDFKKAFFDESTSYKLLPLDININLSDFAAIDKDFSSILTVSSPMARQHFSSSELEKMKYGFDRVKERVNKEGAFTTSLRDEELYRTACRMTFGKDKKSPYIAYGFVKITDKLTELVSFAPVCLVKAKMEYVDGNFYVKQAGKPVANKVFIRNALKDSSLGYDSFMKSLMPTDKKEIFDLFENIRLALKETDDRHIYEIVKEAHIVNVDIDDYTLWCNLALERSMLSQTETVCRLFGNVAKAEGEFDKNYVPVIPVNSNAAKAVLCKGDVLVEGAFTGEKEQVFACAAAKSITEGKSLVVVTDDMEMSHYAKRVLEKEGISYGVLVAEENGCAKDVQNKISDIVEEYKDKDCEKTQNDLTGLFETDKLLKDYTCRLNAHHRLGFTLKQALEACYSANDNSFENEIYVDKSIFENIDHTGLNSIFEEVGELIGETRRLCKNTGLEKYTPVCRHPLFDTRPGKDFDAQAKEQVVLAVDAALPVISEYRDVFLDVNEILGIDNRELDSVYKLEKLNELYKLVLYARDLDIPEKFIESDIADFTRNKRFIAETKKRMEAIRNKLSFFNPEIFEDVETLLSKEEYEDDAEKGFLKKFMHKRNSQEVLLQYVNFSKKAEFMLNKVADIYKLLYEYKSCLKNLKENALYKENVSELETKLAEVSHKAMELVDGISAVSENDKKKRLSNVFRLISVIPVDANLARKITVVRAKLSELYTSENSVIKVLHNYLGLDFSKVVFEDGVLSFDGIGKYLENLVNHLPVLGFWQEWKQRADKARERVPGIVEYLEKHGAGRNVDSLFAKSLFVPVCQCIKEEVFNGFSFEKLGKAKESYNVLLENACDVSRENAKNSYIASVKQIINTENYGELMSENVSSLRELFEKNADVMCKLFPVVIVTKNMLTEVLPLGLVFDRSVIFDNKNNGFSMLASLCFAKKTMIINTSRYDLSPLCQRFKECAYSFDVSEYTENKDAGVFAWINSSLYGEKLVCVPDNNKTSFELVRMNGIYERTTSRTNKTESELAIVKATEILNDKTKKVAICAFTDKQCMAIERLTRVLAKKNRVLDDALCENRICVTTPDRLYLKEYDSLVVSACFGADRDARIGWDFGYASINTQKGVPEAYIEICDRKCDKVYFLTSINVKDARFLRRTGNNAAVYNSFCEMLVDGRVPVNMSRGVEKEDGLLDQLTKSIANINERFRLCYGYIPIKHALCTKNTKLYVFLDNDRNLTMHDELLIKNKLENRNNLVVTLNPYNFAGYDYERTLEQLSRDN